VRRDTAPQSPTDELVAEDPAGEPRKEASEPVPADTPATAVVAPGLDLETASGSAEGAPLERFRQDPTANTLALAVLAAMILALLRSAYPMKEVRGASWPEWATPALCISGLGVAVYLSYVEITGNPATCGPVGDCNTVQQSPYATLFGLVPVGVLGVVGYVSLLALWLGRYLGTGALQRTAAIGLWGMALAGTLFSAYLTYLEPFVIGATCMWCLTSAVVMTLLLLSSRAPASVAFRHDPAGLPHTL
jgi:uncharacterized membrane protein